MCVASCSNVLCKVGKSLSLCNMLPQIATRLIVSCISNIIVTPGSDCIVGPGEVTMSLQVYVTLGIFKSSNPLNERYQ